MLMTCLNLSSPHYQIDPVASGPRGPAKKVRITPGKESICMRNKVKTLETLCMLILTVYNANCVSIIVTELIIQKFKQLTPATWMQQAWNKIKTNIHGFP